jgi:protein tyrosine/serine phosphatase
MSKANGTGSPYVDELGTDQLQPGRRPGNGEAMFPVQGDKNLEAKARSRALAVLRYRHEDELREIYLAEYRYLERKIGIG